MNYILDIPIVKLWETIYKFKLQLCDISCTDLVFNTGLQLTFQNLQILQANLLQKTYSGYHNMVDIIFDW